MLPLAAESLERADVRHGALTPAPLVIVALLHDAPKIGQFMCYKKWTTDVRSI
jgi:hypothetical protein